MSNLNIGVLRNNDGWTNLGEWLLTPVAELAKQHPNHFAFKTSFKASENVGMEIEVEGHDLPETPAFSNYWQAKKDESLRPPKPKIGKKNGAREYVLKRPVSLAVLSGKALPHFQTVFKNHNSEPEMSGRCSVHIHLGVHDMPYYQAIMLAACYYLVEDLLLPLCGDERHGNLFCLGSRDTHDIVFQLQEMLTGSLMNALHHEGNKYTAVNLRTLVSLGTVEFRSMEGTTDIERLKDWASLLCALRDYVRKLSPLDIVTLLTTWSQKGVKQLVEDLFETASDNAKARLYAAADGDDELQTAIYNGIGRMQRLFFQGPWMELVNYEIPKKKTPIVSSTLPQKKTGKMQKTHVLDGMPPEVAQQYVMLKKAALMAQNNGQPQPVPQPLAAAMHALDNDDDVEDDF